MTDPDSLIQIPASEYSFNLFRIDKEFSYTNKGGGVKRVDPLLVNLGGGCNPSLAKPPYPPLKLIKQKTPYPKPLKTQINKSRLNLSKIFFVKDFFIFKINI